MFTKFSSNKIILFSIGLILLFTMLYVAFQTQTTSAKVAFVNNDKDKNFDECQNDSIRLWRQSKADSQYSEQVRLRLFESGIRAQVETYVYGEIDACGNFYQVGFDFVVKIIDQSDLMTDVVRDKIISDVLKKQALPYQLGNIKMLDSTGQQTSTYRDIEDILLVKSITTSTNGWKNLDLSIRPSARYTHGLAYDPEDNVTILFGGDSTGVSRLSDTWQFDGHTWQRIFTTHIPLGRVNIDQAMIYSRQTDSIILFGGLSDAGYLDDTWEYRNGDWHQLSPSNSPTARDSHAIAFDETRNVVVLLGGYEYSSILKNDTWEYYDNNWHYKTFEILPSARFHHAMIYDANRKVIVMFGGMDSSGHILGDLWEYDGLEWRQIVDIPLPPARHNHTIAYDRERQKVILFAGEGLSGILNDLWEYDGLQWVKIDTDAVPWARTESTIIYDEQNKRVLLFGGGFWIDESLTTLNDTWAYIQNPQDSSSLISKKIYVIVYDPLLSNGQTLIEYMNWNSPIDLMNQTINFFYQVSGGLIQYTIEDVVTVNEWPEKVDGFHYTESEYLAVMSGQASGHQPDTVDYNKIVNDPILDICGKANRGELDEVWIFNGPYFGFYESTLVGPNAYWFNSPPVSGTYTCNRLIPIMGPSPERGLAESIHNFGHRTESTLQKTFGSWEQNRTLHDWDRYALVDWLSLDYDYSGCGNIHYPPNGQSDYDYGNTTITMSNCDDFYNYPELGEPVDVIEPVSCSKWNCEHLDFLLYWFEHLPSTEGCSVNGVANNWWVYFANPAFALTPSLSCQSLVFLPFVIR